MSQIINIKHLALLNFMKPHYKSEYLRLYGKIHSFPSFTSYCHAYAKYLLAESSFNLYEIFIDAFNNLTKEDETYDTHKMVQKNLWLSRNYEDLLIKDERTPIVSDSFRFEADFEKLIYENLVNYYGIERNVNRQERLGYGKSDISIDSQLAIELKIGKANRKDVYQAFEYSFGESVKRVCLIAKEIDADVLKIAKKLNVDCYRYAFIREDENTESYPVGIYLEKINNSKSNIFDDYLEDVGCAILFSLYDPHFDFNIEFRKAFQKVKTVTNLTVKTNKEERKKLMDLLEKEGIDTSKGFEYAAKEFRKKVSNE